MLGAQVKQENNTKGSRDARTAKTGKNAATATAAAAARDLARYAPNTRGRARAPDDRNGDAIPD